VSASRVTLPRMAAVARTRKFVVSRRLVWSALIWSVALCSAWPCAAREREHGVALNWLRLPGAQACVPAAELSERVERRLERSVFAVDAAAAFSVDGSVQPSAAGFAVRLSLSDRAGRVLGERTLESADSDCRKLDDALVLVIALMLFPREPLGAAGGLALDADTERLLQEQFRDEPDPLDIAAPAPGTPHTHVTEAATRANDTRPSAAQRPDVADTPPTAARRDVASLTAAGILSAGYLPAPAPGVEVALLISPVGVWPWRLSGLYLPAQERRARALVSGATRFSLGQVALAVCPWQAGIALQLRFCGGLAAGLLQVKSSGYAGGSTKRSDPMLNAQAEFDLHWHVSDYVLLQFGAVLALPLTQRGYAYQGLDAQSQLLFRTAQLSGRIGLGVGVAF
jgi:hypothetical protein